MNIKLVGKEKVRSLFGFQP